MVKKVNGAASAVRGHGGDVSMAPHGWGRRGGAADHGRGIDPCALVQWLGNERRGCEARPRMLADEVLCLRGK